MHIVIKIWLEYGYDYKQSTLKQILEKEDDSLDESDGRSDDNVSEDYKSRGKLDANGKESDYQDLSSRNGNEGNIEKIIKGKLRSVS